MGVLTQLFVVSFELPTLQKRNSITETVFYFIFFLDFCFLFFGNEGLDSQRIMEAHSPSLHVYTYSFDVGLR